LANYYLARYLGVMNAYQSFAHMNEISRSRMSWVFYKDNDEYILSVVCGTVGIFETVVKLSASEVSSYTEKGDDFIDNLAAQIRFKPENYASRIISNFTKSE
jgi:hypothetical protein